MASNGQQVSIELQTMDETNNATGLLASSSGDEDESEIYSSDEDESETYRPRTGRRNGQRSRRPSDEDESEIYSSDENESEIYRPRTGRRNGQRSRRPRYRSALQRCKMFFVNHRNVIFTSVHYAMFGILGLMMSIPGPTLIDLISSSKTDATTISFIFTARSLGFFFGSISGGCILDRMKNEYWAFIASSFVVSLGAWLVPWCRNLLTLLITFGVAGIAMGFCNTGSNGCLLRMYGPKGAPFLQGLHFFYGVGGFIAPLVAVPFLSAPVPTASFLNETQNIASEMFPNTTELLAAPFFSAPVPIAEDSTFRNGTQNIASEMFPNTTELLAAPVPIAEDLFLLNGTKNIPSAMFPNTTEKALSLTPAESAILKIFSIIGGAAAIACAGFVALALLSSNEKSGVEESDPAAIRNPSKSFTALVVLLACLQTGLTSGVEVSFTQMLTSYVVKSPHNLPKSTGSYMTSVYWGAFTLTRGLCIPLTLKIPVKYLLIGDHVLSVLSAVILLTVAPKSVYALWIGTALLGVGVASIFPATLSWVEKYVQITNSLASVFTAISSILEMTVPWCISRYLGTQPDILFQFLTAATLLCFLLFVTLNVILARKGEKRVQEKEASKGNQDQETSPPKSSV